MHISHITFMTLEEILSIATTYNCPLRYRGCSNYPMQPKLEVDPHKIMMMMMMTMMMMLLLVLVLIFYYLN
jgi:heme/copper-type cytochrome/quinol oxidase subunit 2